MTKRRAELLVAVTVLALGIASSLFAHEGHEHKVMGTITMAAADHVMLKDTDGKDVAIQVTKDTKVKSKPPMKVEEIKAGTRVVVLASMEKNNTLKAKAIEVGAPPSR